MSSSTTGAGDGDATGDGDGARVEVGATATTGAASGGGGADGLSATFSAAFSTGDSCKNNKKKISFFFQIKLVGLSM